MKKLFAVLVFLFGLSQTDAIAQDSWKMESIDQIMEKDSISGRRYFRVVFRVVPSGMHGTDSQLEHSRIWSQNFEPQFYLSEIRKAKETTGEEKLRRMETKENNPKNIEEFISSPLETEVYGELGYMPKKDTGDYSK